MFISKTKQIASAMIFAVPVMVHAGVVNGGGGKGVVCRNPDHSIKSVEVLDLWEARVEHHEIPVGFSANLAKDTQALLNHLKRSIQIQMKETDGPAGPVICNGADCVIKDLSEFAQPFLAENDPGILRLHGVNLENTHDALELVRPAGCKIEQIVNYQPAGGQILVNQDLVDKMDEINQAALIAHEAFYQFLKHDYGEANSLRVRRAVGFVATGKDLVTPAELSFAKGQLICSSDPTGRPTEGAFPFYDIDTNYLIVDPSQYKLDFRMVSGNVLIGDSQITDWSNNKEYMKILFEQQGCPSLSVTTRVSGPVEYDRGLEISRLCEDLGTGKSVFSMSVRAPGEAKYKRVTLTCRPLTEPFPY